MAGADCYMAPVSSKERMKKKNQVAAMPLRDTAEMEAGLGITPFPIGMHWQWVLCREGWV